MPLPIPLILAGAAVATKVIPIAIGVRKLRKARDADTARRAGGAPGRPGAAAEAANDPAAFVRVGMPRGRR